MLASQECDALVAVLGTEALNHAAAVLLGFDCELLPVVRTVVIDHERVDGAGQRPAGTDLNMGHARKSRSVGCHEFLRTGEARKRHRLAAAVEGLKGQVEALYVSPDPVLMANRIRINTLANVARLPTIYIREGMGRSRNLHVLWVQLRRLIPSLRRYYRQALPWNCAPPHPGHAAHQNLSHPQTYHRQTP